MSTFDPDALVKLVAELKRVMRPDADMLISMCLGHNVLNFNNGWFMDMDALRRVFKGWTIVDHLVDFQSSPRSLADGAGERFSSDTSIASIPATDYRVIFLHLRQSPASSESVTR